MITKLYTYFGQENMLPIIKKESDLGLKTVIVDDCSPKPLSKVEGIDCYRITDDIAWNQTGAKNLGFHVSEGWILCSDIDNILTFEMAKRLNEIDLKEGTVYFFPYMYNGKIVPEHENPHSSVLMHKSDWEKCGGFEEDFAGGWGWDDLFFYDLCSRIFKVVYLDSIYLFHYEFGAANLERDGSRSQKIYNDNLNTTKVTSPKLRFTWHKL